jgi:hypothetical protein
MANVVAGAVSLAASLVLLGVGVAIRRDAFGISAKNARLTARMFGHVGDPREVRESVQRRSWSAAAGFIAVGGVMAVIDALWIAKSLA